MVVLVEKEEDRGRIRAVWSEELKEEEDKLKGTEK